MHSAEVSGGVLGPSEVKLRLRGHGRVLSAGFIIFMASEVSVRHGI